MLFSAFCIKSVFYSVSKKKELERIFVQTKVYAFMLLKNLKLTVCVMSKLRICSVGYREIDLKVKPVSSNQSKSTKNKTKKIDQIIVNVLTWLNVKC